jgi:hypothetical protein
LSSSPGRILAHLKKGWNINAKIAHRYRSGRNVPLNKKKTGGTMLEERGREKKREKERDVR